MRRALLATLFLLLALGCAAKKDLDKTATALREAATAGDYEGFTKLFVSPEEIAQKFPPAKLEMVSKTLKAMGAYKDQSMKSISVKSGQPDQGKYEIQFEKGTAMLDLEVVDGKLVSFRFYGDDFENALKANAGPPLQTGQFRFVKAQGEPIPGKKVPVGPVRFALGVAGIKAANDKLSFQWSVKLMKGEEVVDQHQQTINEPAGGKQYVTGTLSHTFEVKEPGSYLLRFDIQDNGGQRGARHDEPFEVVAAAAQK
jgi:hypothetical protein